MNNDISEVKLGNINTIKNYGLQNNNLKELKLPEGFYELEDEALTNNKQFVKLTGYTTYVESSKIPGELGHVKDFALVTIESIDAKTGKTIMDDYVLGDDFTDEDGIVLKGIENKIKPVKIQGYYPVKKEIIFTPEKDKETIIIEYLSDKTKPVIKVIKDLNLELNSDGSEETLKSIIQATDYKGDIISPENITVIPNNIDTTKEGFTDVVYEVIDDKGNITKEIITIGVNKDYSDLEIGEGWTLGDFTYDEDKPYIVTGFSSKGLEKVKTNKNLVLPTMNPNNPEITITEIKDSAFQDLEDIESLNLSKIEIVGTNSFKNAELKTLIGNEVKEVKDNGFENSNFNEINLPNAIYIGDNAFAKSEAKSVRIPKVTKVGLSSFESATLEEDFIIDNLVETGDRSFSSINRSDLNAPKLEIIGRETFHKYYYDTVLENPITELNAPNLKKIDVLGLGTAQLTEFNQDKLEYLGERALATAPLKEITIDNIEYIGPFVFEGAIGSIDYNNYLVIKSKNANANGVFNKENYIINPNKEEAKKQDSRFYEDDFIYADEEKTEIIALSETGMMKLCKNDFHLVLPDNVKVIGPGVFYNSNIKSVVGKNVVEVKDRSFESTRNLDFVHFPNLKTVGYQGFMNSTLKDLNFPNLERIEYGGFSGVSLNEDSKVDLSNLIYLGSSGLYNVGLTELELENVEYIGQYSLVGNNLEYLDIRNVKEIEPNAITNLNMDTLTLNKLEKLDKDSFSYWYEDENTPKTHKNIFILNEDGSFNNESGVESSEYITVNPSNRYIKFVDENGVEISKQDTVIVNKYKYENGSTIYEPTNLYGYELISKPFDLEDFNDEEVITVEYKKIEDKIVHHQNGLQFDAIYSNNGKQNYLIGDNMSLRLKVNLTTDAEPLENPVMRVYFDENDVDISRVTTDTSTGFVDNLKIGKGYVDIQLKTKINAGDSLEIPLNDFTFKKYVSEDNIETLIYTELLREGDLIAEKGPLKYTGYYNKPVYKESIKTPVTDMKPTTDGPRDFGSMGYIGPKDNAKIGVVNPKDVEISYVPMDIFGNKTSEIERNIEKYIIEHELPLYSKVNEDGSVTMERASFNPETNPGWVLSEDGVTVVYETEIYPTNKLNTPKLKLQFPGIENDTQTESSFKMTLIPHNKGDNESNIIIEDSIKIYPFARFFPGEEGETYFDKRSIGTPRYNGDLGFTYLFDYKSDKEKNIPFKITFGGKSDKENNFYFKNTTITDYKLDEKLKYTGLMLPEIMGERVTVKTYRKINSVINPLNDLVIQEQEFLLNSPSRMEFKNQEDIDYIQIIFDKDFIIDDMYEIIVNTEFKDKETAVYNNDNITQNKMWNRAIMSGDYVNDKGISIQEKDLWGTIYTSDITKNKEIYEEIKEDTKYIEGNSVGVRDDFVEILDMKTVVGLEKKQIFYKKDKEDLILKEGVNTKIQEGIVKDTPLNNSPTITTDMRGLYSLTLTPEEKEGVFEDYTDFKLVELLPKEVAFERFVLNPELKKTSENLKVEIIPDYEDTGLTGVIITADKLGKQAKHIIDIYVEVLENTVNDSFIKNEVKATWSNPKIEKAYERDKDNYTVSNEVTVKTSSAMAMISKKKIRNYEENLPRNFGWKEHIETPSEGLFEYKLSVFNGTDNNTANVTMVDFFPHTNDYSIQFLNEDTKERVPRLSEFSNTLDLDREIIVPEGYTVKYHISDYDIGLGDLSADEVIKDLNWVDEPGTDPTKIKAIKVEGHDNVLKAGDTAEVIIPMKAPINDFNSEFSVNGKKAVNSFVMKEAVTKELAEKTRFLEPNTVSNTMIGPRGSIEAKKYGKLGILQEIFGAKPLEGAKFELRNSRDEIVEVVTTDSEGTILFTDVDVFDTYTIREIESPEGYLPSDEVLRITSEDFMEVHDKDYKVVKDTKELFLNRKPYKGSLKLQKVDNKGNKLSNVGFTLTSLDENQEKIVLKKYTDNEGLIEFKDILEGRWLLEEITIDTITSLEPIEPIEIIIDKDNRDYVYTLDNDTPLVNNTGQIVLNKLSVANGSNTTDLDDIISTKQIKLPNHEFIIKNDKGEEVQRVRTNEQGTTIIRNLTLNEKYTIEEVKESVDEKHKYNNLVYPFMLKSDGTIINLNNDNKHRENVINFPNERKDLKGNITINKTDNKGNKLENAEFTLYDVNNNIVAVKKSDKEGKVLFSDLPKGIYTLKETKAPKGYFADYIKENIVISEVETEEYTIDYAKEDLEVNYEFNIINKPLELKLIKGSQYIMARIDEAKEFVKENPEYRFMEISDTMARIYKPLENIEFELFTSDDVSQGKYLSDKEGIVDFKDFVFEEDLEYYLIETKTDINYKLNSRKIKINPSMYKLQEGFDGLMEIYFDNIKKTGSINISKYGELTKDKLTALEGVEFTIYEVVDGKEIEISKTKTNSSGLAVFKDLKLNHKYIVRETETLDGFVLSDEVLEFTPTGENNTKQFVLYNYLDSYNLEFTKIDGDSKEILSNVIFGLYPEGTTLEDVREETIDPIETIKSNEEGKVIITDLKPGNYVIYELQTLQEYMLSDKSINITEDMFSKDLENRTLILEDFENFKLNASIVDTGTIGTKPIVTIVAILLISYVITRKRKNIL